MTDSTRLSSTPEHAPQPAANPADGGGGLALGAGDLVANTYRIVREVAKGGMGALFEGRHDITGERVAIKAVLEGLAGDPRAVKMFEREAIALSKVRHDAIVGYRDILRDHKNQLFIIMDFVDGKPLSHFVGRAHLPADGVRTLARRLAEGLAATHAAGVTHRDISPKNILLPDDEIDKAIIIDFGIAKHMNEHGQTVIGDSFTGTLSHAAPEQLGLFSAHVDQRADIYALGIVLAQVAGAKFDLGERLAEAVLSRQHDLGLPADMDPDLRAMLEPMLRADPGQRPASMAQAVLDRPAAGPGPEGGDQPTKIQEAGGANDTIARIQGSGGEDQTGGLAPGSDTTGGPNKRRSGKKAIIGALAAAVVGLIALIGAFFWYNMSGGLGLGPSEHVSFEQARAIVEDDARSVADKIAAAKTLTASGQFEQLDVAFGVFLKLARDGSADAALEAARMYDPEFHSFTTSPLNAPNTRQALHWYKRAAEGGRSDAASHVRRLEEQ